MDVNRLLSDELIYELRVRGLSAEGSQAERRSVLRGRLRLEKTGCHFQSVTVPFDMEGEVDTCRQKLDELDEQVRNFDRGNKVNEYQRIHSRLLHVIGRVNRLASCADFADATSSLMTHCARVEDDLERRFAGVERPSCPAESILDHPNVVEPGVSLLDDAPPLLPSVTHEPTIRVTAEAVEPLLNVSPVDPPAFFPQARRTGIREDERPQASSPSHPELPIRPMAELSMRDEHKKFFVPIHKWNIYFDGESDLLSFLERVEELREARGVSKDQLLSAGAEMFKGSALYWFRSVRHSIHDWDTLVRKLRATFLPCDFEMTLMDEIRGRTQGASERVAVYIAKMENLFGRLGEKQPESVRAALIRRNLLPYLQERIALFELTRVSELTRVCLMVEDVQTRVAQYKSPPTSGRLLAPDLAYRGPRGSTRVSELQCPAEVSSSGDSRAAVQPIAVDSVPVARTGINQSRCWNCRTLGHNYRTCTQPRVRFCYRCGRPDATTRSCATCSGNGVRGHGATEA